MTLYTIGYTKKSLRDFIGRLQKHNIDRVVDVRLHNTSQLAGFAKKDDLAYILELHKIRYEHQSILAPTDELLKLYAKKKINWLEYERQFKQLLQQRKSTLPAFDGDDEHICFLCTEDRPDHCHRRLVANYYKNKEEDIEIVHI